MAKLLDSRAVREPEEDQNGRNIFRPDTLTIIALCCFANQL